MHMCMHMKNIHTSIYPYRMMQTSFIAVQQLSKMVEKFGRLDAQSLRCLELVMAVETTGRRATELETETVAKALPAAVTNGVLQFFEEENESCLCVFICFYWILMDFESDYRISDYQENS